MLFSIVAAPVYIPTHSVGGSLFSTPSPAFVVCYLFDNSHSDRCEVVSHCGFDLRFEEVSGPPDSQQHYSQQSRRGNNLSVCQQRNE